MSSLLTVKNAIREGLATTLSISESNLIPVGYTGKIPKKPYVMYGFFSMRQHPGRRMGFNPTTPSNVEWLPVSGAPALTGTTTNFRTQHLIDTAADFVAAEVAHFWYVKNLDTEETTVILKVVNLENLWLWSHIFPDIGADYELRQIKQRKYYDKPQTQGLALTFIHDTEENADVMADQGLEWFQLPTKANAVLLPLGWRVVDPGNVLPTDFLQQKQARAYSRELTVMLKGNEVLFEDVDIIETVKLTVEGQHGGLPDPTPLIDREVPPGQL